jgi:hypothetical protein
MNKIVQLSPSSRVSPHRACRQLGKGGRWALAAFSTLLQLQRQHAFDQACCHRKSRLNSLLKRSRRPKAPKYPHFVGSVFTSNVSKLSFFVQKEMGASKSRWQQTKYKASLVPRRPCICEFDWTPDWFSPCGVRVNPKRTSLPRPNQTPYIQ